MLLALSASAVALLALAWEAGVPSVSRSLARRRSLRTARLEALAADPGRERRAEVRARALLRSCVEREDWEMYRELGFLRVWGRCTAERGEYAYLIYPHRPIVAFVPRDGRLLSEYCVEFPDRERPYGSSRLPPSDDVLAKWMALTADERRLLASANMHLAGHQVDPAQVQRDLHALERWERERAVAKVPAAARIEPAATEPVAAAERRPAASRVRRRGRAREARAQ